MIGLDYSGKTTILYKLKHVENILTNPTEHYNIEIVETSNMMLELWDVGGREKVRPAMQKHYIRDCVAMIYVLDTTQDRFEEAKEEFFRNVNDMEFSKDGKILIYSNKKDLDTYKDPSELIEKWELNHLKFKWKIQPCSAKSGEGLLQGIEWLSNELINQ